jgi:hypothetical protein
MERKTQDLEPAEEYGVNRLVVGGVALKVESFEPLGQVSVATPSGPVTLAHAAAARCRGRAGTVTYLFGEHEGHLVGAQTI